MRKGLTRPGRKQSGRQRSGPGMAARRARFRVWLLLHFLPQVSGCAGPGSSLGTPPGRGGGSPAGMRGSSRAESGHGRSRAPARRWSRGPGGACGGAGGLAWSGGVSRSGSRLLWPVRVRSRAWAARQQQESAAARSSGGAACGVSVTELRPAFSRGKKTTLFAPQAVPRRLCRMPSAIWQYLYMCIFGLVCFGFFFFYFP